MNASIRLRVGILGVGAIGRTMAMALDAKRIDAELVAISDQDIQRAEAVSAELASRPRVVSVHELIQRSDLVVEAAQPGCAARFRA